MKRVLIGISSILTIMATHANAADVVVDPIPVATSFNWGGAYIGGQIGYGWGTTGFSGNSSDTGEFGLDGISSDGILGGIYAGYNFDTGTNLILGVDGDFTGSAISRSITGYDEEGDVVGGKTKLLWSGAVRARAGYALDRFMPYIAGGVAFGHIKDTFHYEGETVHSQQKTKTGWTAGGGADYALTDNVIMRLEYRYTDFGKRGFDVDNIDDGNLGGKTTSNDVRLGVAYKF